MSMIRRNLKRRAAQKAAFFGKEASDKSIKPDLPFVTVPEKRYTKTEINRMSTAELKSFASERGIDNAEELTGAKLKKVLIEKLGS